MLGILKKLQIQPLTSHEWRIVMHVHNPSTQEGEAERSEVQSLLWLYKKLEDSLAF